MIQPKKACVYPFDKLWNIYLNILRIMAVSATVLGNLKNTLQMCLLANCH